MANPDEISYRGFIILKYMSKVNRYTVATSIGILWLHQYVNIETNVMLIKIQPDATVCRYLFTAESFYMFRVSQVIILVQLLPSNVA